MKRRLILLVATICVFLVAFLIWQSYSESNDFSSMEGEIMIMQQMNPTETPMYKFNLQTDALLPFHNNFFEPHYSVNNGNKLLAVIQNGDEQDIYEIEDDNASYSKREKIIAGKNIQFPKSIPGRHAISFIEEGELKVYDRDTGSLTSIASLDSGYLYYDWLDSNRVLFTAQDEQKSPHIMSFNLTNHQLDEYKSNASNPSLSYNKKYIAYQQSNETNVVHIDSITGNDHSTIQVDTQGVLPYKPSPDGKYLLTNMYTNSISNVVIIHIPTAKIKTLLRSTWAEYLDWKL